jgi:ACS family hexuronate transporter-like MFS transporter
MLTMTVSYVDRNVFNVLGQTITEALDMTDYQFGLLGSAFALAYLFATPLGGRWIDRVGARRGLVASVLVWSAIAGLHALVPGFGTLFLLRIALGAAEGPSFPGSAQTMARALPPGDRSRGYALLFTGSSIGSMIAPKLASWLYGVSHNWRIAMLTSAAIGLSWLPLWLFATRRSVVGTQLDEAPATTGEPKPTFRELLNNLHIVRAIIGIFACAPATLIWGAWGAKFLATQHSVKQVDMGHYLWLPPLCLDIGAILFGDLYSRIARPRVLLVIAIAMVSSIAFVPFAHDVWTAVAFASVSIAGGGAMYTVITADAMSRVPAAGVSVAGGLIAAGQSTAVILVNPLIGRAVDHWHNYDNVCWGIAAWVIPGSLVWLLWKPSR